MLERRRSTAAVAALLVLALGGCAHGREVAMSSSGPPGPAAATAGSNGEILGTPIHEEVGPPSPVYAPPDSSAGRGVWKSALSATGKRIVVSVDHRWLWLMDGDSAVFGAPVAVGTPKHFTYGGRTYDFRTPRMRRKVLDKEAARLWVPPDWHYLEKAADEDLDVVRLKKGQHYALPDSTVIEVRGDEVGRVNRFGNFWPFTPGTEIIFAGRIFIPPVGTSQRQVPDVLGTHSLYLGDGYLIHGTNEEDSIGEPVSHGCVRMYNDDVDRLYGMVSVGTPVYIY